MINSTTQPKWAEEFDTLLPYGGENIFDSLITIITPNQNGSNTPVYSTRRIEFKSFLHSQLTALAEEMEKEITPDIIPENYMTDEEKKVMGEIWGKANAIQTAINHGVGYNNAKRELRNALQELKKKWGLV